MGHYIHIAGTQFELDSEALALSLRDRLLEAQKLDVAQRIHLTLKDGGVAYVFVNKYTTVALSSSAPSMPTPQPGIRKVR